MKVLSATLVSLMLLSACAPVPRPAPRSALQVRALQTREYQTKDTKLVMKALLNVLQDEGFVTKNAVVDLGLITAEKELDREDQTSMIFRSLIGGHEARWPKTEIIEGTANVSEFGGSTRVRISFKRKVLDNRGNAMSIEEVEDAYYYQDFFSKVDKGIFIQREKI